MMPGDVELGDEPARLSHARTHRVRGVDLWACYHVRIDSAGGMCLEGSRLVG